MLHPKGHRLVFFRLLALYFRLSHTEINTSSANFKQICYPLFTGRLCKHSFNGSPFPLLPPTLFHFNASDITQKYTLYFAAMQLKLQV